MCCRDGEEAWEDLAAGEAAAADQRQGGRRRNEVSSMSSRFKVITPFGETRAPRVSPGFSCRFASTGNG
jgi:hypothetical protein